MVRKWKASAHSPSGKGRRLSLPASGQSPTPAPASLAEKEVRALVWDLTKSPRNPSPHDEPDGLSYPVDVNSLVQTVILAPQAARDCQDEARELLQKHDYGTIPVEKSGFTGYGHLLPNGDEIIKYSNK